MTLRHINKELRRHAPFTLAGAVSGIFIMAGLALANAPARWMETLFWTFHPLHVFLSAMVTASMYRFHGRHKFWPTVVVGYFGSIGIATLNDCIIPFIGETLLELPNRGLHLGVIENGGWSTPWHSQESGLRCIDRTRVFRIPAMSCGVRIGRTPLVMCLNPPAQ